MDHTKEELVLQIMKFLIKRENKLQQIETMFKNKEVDLDKLYKLVTEKEK